MTNDGDSVTLSGSKTKKLKTKSGKTIAKVSKTTYDVSTFSFFTQYKIANINARI